jgi:hypothetical protein
LNGIDLRVISVALSLVEAEVIFRIRAKVGGLVLAVFAFVLDTILVKGAFAVAKELCVAERIQESILAFSSVVALVVPGTGFKDGITQDTRPSMRTIAVLVIDIFVLVKVKIGTVGVLKVLGEIRGSFLAFIVSAVQVTYSLYFLSKAAQGSKDEE